MADTSALDALAALADELEAAKAAVRSYERMLNWHVTCERCAAQLDELYEATVAREVLAAALDSPPGAATLVELATEAARRLTGITDLDAERAAHMQRWAVSRRTEQAMTEADACAAAYALIGQAHRRPYAGDPDLKRLRRDALDALMTLDRALYAKAFALFADNPKEADRG